MKWIRNFLVTLAGLGTAVVVSASPITYVFSGLASGTLDGATFINQQFSLRIQGDTANVIPDPDGPLPPHVFINYLGLSNSISSGDLLTDFIPTREDLGQTLIVFVNQQTRGVGFGRGNVSQSSYSGNKITIHDDSLATYDLTRPFGPIHDAAP